MFFFFKDMFFVYDVIKMIIFMIFFFGGYDVLVNKIDVEVLIFKLFYFEYYECFSKWNYIDFVFGIDVKEILYDKFVDIMKGV